MTEAAILRRKKCFLNIKFLLLIRLVYRLGMNNIIDISDNSEGSHLAQLDEDKQNDLVESLTDNPMEQQTDQYDCQDLETIINKMSRLR